MLRPGCDEIGPLWFYSRLEAAAVVKSKARAEYVEDEMTCKI